MKSEAEIKEFIDSREVLTKLELVYFISGLRHKNNHALTERWWLYTLQTKNLENLYKYKIHKINNSNARKDKHKILELLKTDIRLKKSGTRNQAKYLEQFYNIKVSRKTLISWRKENAKIN